MVFGAVEAGFTTGRPSVPRHFETNAVLPCDAPKLMKNRKGGTYGSPFGRIGVPRFELGASPTRTERATRLRHTPRRRRVAGFSPDGRGDMHRLRVGSGRWPTGAIARYANDLLDVAERWPEFAPPGLQVIGAGRCQLSPAACSAPARCRAAVDRRAAGARPPGLSWRNEPLVVDMRLRRQARAAV